MRFSMLAGNGAFCLKTPNERKTSVLLSARGQAHPWAALFRWKEGGVGGFVRVVEMMGMRPWGWVFEGLMETRPGAC